MNPDLERLHPYPFERLHDLLPAPPQGREAISLAIGEPRQPTPGLITEALARALDGLARYPVTRGQPDLREAIAAWLSRRFRIPATAIDPHSQVLPVTGTREALFALAQAVIDRRVPAKVAMPNPFYQIYEGAALLAGAEPVYLNCTAETGYLPDWRSVSDATWRQCQLAYITSPGNPTGAVMPASDWTALMELAERHDFILAADECYSELYPDGTAPPPGLLEAAYHSGNTAFRRCIVFHSLSKRSSAPGLRSGFVAGDAELLARFLRYRTYHGCALPPPVQAASRAAWEDESHVIASRKGYDERFATVLEILGPVLPVERPAAGFYLWPEVPLADTDFAARLYGQEGVLVLPGSFLSRAAGGDPGAGRVRMALVQPTATCTEAASRIRRFVESL